MAIILTQNSMDNTNIDGARAEYFNSGMRDGIVKGAFNEGTFTTLASNQISFDTCELRISGHRVVVEETWTRTFSTKPKTPMRYALIGQIIVGEDLSVQFELFPQLASTALIKNNLFRQQNGAGTYQVEIGRFTLNTDGNIVDVTRTLDIITGSKGEDLDGTINIGIVNTNTLDPELDAEVDVEQRYDAEQKKIVTDFNFNIPRGKEIEVDTALSTTSTNAVQNSVIAKAVNDLQTEKADKADLENKADKSEIPDISGKADLTNDQQEITAKKISLNSSGLHVGNGQIEYKDISGLNFVGVEGFMVNKSLRAPEMLLVDKDIVAGHSVIAPQVHGDTLIGDNMRLHAYAGIVPPTISAEKSLTIDTPTTTFSGDVKVNNENVLTKSSLLELVYPIGSLYMTLNYVNPETFLGGRWVPLPADYALWTASSDAGKTIPAGLPNITGTTGNATSSGSLIAQDAGGFSGAMYLNNIASRKVSDGSSGKYSGGSIGFNASLSNSIYGSSTTVQPPAYKVYVWKRTE